MPLDFSSKTVDRSPLQNRFASCIYRSCIWRTDRWRKLLKTKTSEIEKRIFKEQSNRARNNSIRTSVKISLLLTASFVHANVCVEERGLGENFSLGGDDRAIDVKNLCKRWSKLWPSNLDNLRDRRFFCEHEATKHWEKEKIQVEGVKTIYHGDLACLHWVTDRT